MRSYEISAAPLTGSAKVIENHFYWDEVVWRKRRTVGQMFFQPYESKEEFIFCARHTFSPMVIIGLAVLDPIGAAVGPAIMLGLSAVCGIIGGLSKLSGDQMNASVFLDKAEYIMKNLCQALVDIVMLPLLALAMLTRGISTGLQAAGIVGEQGLLPSPSF